MEVYAVRRGWCGSPREFDGLGEFYSAGFQRRNTREEPVAVNSPRQSADGNKPGLSGGTHLSAGGETKGYCGGGGVRGHDQRARRGLRCSGVERECHVGFGGL